MKRAAALFVLLAASPAAAQPLGTSFSGTAIADGASPYTNPASMGAARGTHLELDVGLQALSARYTPDGGLDASSTSAIGPIATLGGFTDAADPNLRIGLSFGLLRTAGGNWARDDGAAQITRYFIVQGTSFHIGLIPAVSYTPVDWLTIGLGASFVYANIGSQLDKDFGSQLNQTAGSDTIDSPFPYAHPDLAAPISVSGDGFGVGAIGGVHARPIPELALGLSLHSPVVIAGGGTLSVTYPERLREFVADVAPDATLPDLNGSIGVDLDIPLQLMLGASAYPHPQVELAADYRFEHLSSQPNFNVRIIEATSDAIDDTTKVQAYRDRHSVFFRATYLPIPELRVAIFASWNSNTVPDSTAAPNNLDFDRFELGLAVRWRIVREVSVTAQYSHLFLPDRNVTQSLHRPLTQPSLAAFNHPSPTGVYSASVETARIGVIVHL
jgi:long-subunit fatty acid transport protein